MTNKELDDYMKTVNPDFNSHIEKGTIEMNNEYYNLLEEKMARLINETQELKKQLEEANKKLYLCTPEIPQNVHGKYVSYVDLVNEMYELKKQVEERTKMYQNAYDYSQKMEGKAIILEAQQKEFIKYLENRIDICDGFLDTVKSDLQEISYGAISVNKTYITTQIKENEIAHKVYEEILQKYKEIIEKGDVR